MVQFQFWNQNTWTVISLHFLKPCHPPCVRALLPHQGSAWPNHAPRYVSFLSLEHDGVWLVPCSWIIPSINQIKTLLTAVTDIHELAFKQRCRKLLVEPYWQKYSKFVGNIRSEWWELCSKSWINTHQGKQKRPCCFHRANINLLISWLKRKWKNDSQQVPLLLLS